MKDISLFCELFIDYPGEREELIKLMSKIIVGNPGKFGIVTSQLLEINIKKNELYNSLSSDFFVSKAGSSESYLYYKYRIDVETATPDVDGDSYLSEIEKLTKIIMKHGFDVVVSPSLEQMKEVLK